MRFTSATLLAFICFSVAGCATPTVAQLEVLPAADHEAILVQDQRPATEKTSEMLSLIITNEAYGIARMGDEGTNPDRITYLKQALAGLAGKKIAGKTVIVNSFTIHKNNQSRMRTSVNSTQGLLVMAVLQSMEKRAEQMQPGWFDPTENPGGGNVAVFMARVTIDGKEYRARVVKQAPGTTIHFHGSPEVWEKVIAAGMRETAARLAEAINKD